MSLMEKWILGCTLVMAAAMVVAIGISLRRSRVTVEPQPVVVEKAAKRFSKELCDSRHEEISRRLDEHERLIEDIRVDRERKWKELQGQYSELGGTLEYMRGQFDLVLKRLEDK